MKRLLAIIVLLGGLSALGAVSQQVIHLPLTVANGGTGATSGSSARTNLGIVEGTFSPSVTPVSNIDSVSASTLRYVRVGDSVMCWGTVTVDATFGSGYTTFRLELPVESSLAANADLAGNAGFQGTPSERTWNISADTTNEAAFFETVIVQNASKTFSYNFMYKVL